MLLLGRTQMVDTCSYEESIRRLMKCGFDGVEAGVFDRGFHVRDEFFSDGFGRRMRDIMESCGVKGYSVSAHVDFTECEEKFRLVYDAIAVAGEMEAPLLIINGADIAEEVKEIVNLVHTYLGNTAELQNNLSGENMDTVLKFMEEMVAAPDFKDKMYEKIHDDAQKLREMEAAE